MLAQEKEFYQSLLLVDRYHGSAGVDPLFAVSLLYEK